MGSKKPSGRMEIDNSLSHTVAEGGRKKFQHDFDEVSTNVCRWTVGCANKDLRLS